MRAYTPCDRRPACWPRRRAACHHAPTNGSGVGLAVLTTGGLTRGQRKNPGDRGLRGLWLRKGDTTIPVVRGRPQRRYRARHWPAARHWISVRRSSWTGDSTRRHHVARSGSRGHCPARNKMDSTHITLNELPFVQETYTGMAHCQGTCRIFSAKSPRQILARPARPCDAGPSGPRRLSKTDGLAQRSMNRRIRLNEASISGYLYPSECSSVRVTPLTAFVSSCFWRSVSLHSAFCRNRT